MFQEQRETKATLQEMMRRPPPLPKQQRAPPVQQETVLKIYRRTVALFVLFWAVVIATPLAASGSGDALGKPSQKPVVLKLATLAPIGSPWHQMLLDINEAWREASDGRLRLQIYAGGVAGDDGDVVVKMRLGQLQAAGLAAQGLGIIDEGIYGLTLPMIFQSRAEVEWMRAQVEDELRRRMDAAGFVLIGWFDVGWIYWFGREPIRVPADLQAMRIFTWSGGPDMESIWAGMGVQSVSLAATDVLAGLQMGLIDAVAISPLIAASHQFFGVIPNMTNIKWADMPGALVVTKKAWATVPDGIKPQLFEAVERVSRDAKERLRKMDAEAIEVMVSYGLNIVDLTPEEIQSWFDLIEPNLHLLKGVLVDSAMYDIIMDLRKEMPPGLREAGH